MDGEAASRPGQAHQQYAVDPFRPQMASSQPTGAEARPREGAMAQPVEANGFGMGRLVPYAAHPGPAVPPLPQEMHGHPGGLRHSGDMSDDSGAWAGQAGPGRYPQTSLPAYRPVWGPAPGYGAPVGAVPGVAGPPHLPPQGHAPEWYPAEYYPMEQQHAGAYPPGHMVMWAYRGPPPGTPLYGHDGYGHMAVTPHVPPPGMMYGRPAVYPLPEGYGPAGTPASSLPSPSLASTYSSSTAMASPRPSPADGVGHAPGRPVAPMALPSPAKYGVPHGYGPMPGHPYPHEHMSMYPGAVPEARGPPLPRPAPLVVSPHLSPHGLPLASPTAKVATPGSTSSGMDAESSVGSSSLSRAMFKPTGFAGVALPNESSTELPISLAALEAGTEHRTTVMIRHIPNKYSSQLLLAEIDALGLRGCYDFFYLPIEFQTGLNMGFAFVNFGSPAYVLRLYSAWHGEMWPHYTSRKACKLLFARIQGRTALISRFRNSPIIAKAPPEFQPILFHRAGPLAGQRQPWAALLAEGPWPKPGSSMAGSSASWHGAKHSGAGGTLEPGEPGPVAADSPPSSSPLAMSVDCAEVQSYAQSSATGSSGPPRSNSGYPPRDHSRAFTYHQHGPDSDAGLYVALPSLDRHANDLSEVSQASGQHGQAASAASSSSHRGLEVRLRSFERRQVLGHGRAKARGAVSLRPALPRGRLPGLQ